MIRWCVAGARA